MDEESRTDLGYERTNRRRLRTLYILPCFYLFVTFVVLVPVALNLKKEEDGGNTLSSRRHVLEADTELTNQCIPASIDSFPDDFFTQEQRRKGGVVIHFLIMLYTCAMLAVICDDYFLPSLDIISEKLKLPSDVAGATFMAIGTSSPEFFSSVIGSFITEGDIGVGTVVGSAVFNVFGVTGLAGIAVWRTEVHIDWYPVTRDTSVYLVTIAALTIMISDNVITWWESLILLIMFGMYVVLMYSNKAVESYCRKKMKSLKRKLEACCRCLRNDETASLLGSKVYVPEMAEKVKSEKSMSESKDSFSVDLTMDRNAKPAENDAIMKEKNVRENLEPAEGKTEPDEVSLCSPPKRAGNFIWWLVMWPASLLFYFTIPDSRKTSMRKFYVITFLSSTIWLGAASYVCVWMVTIIGYTLSIPDTVSGLTILAIGTSLPEMFSSIIVVRNGLGNMVMANLIGSNIFDILFCLGAPWLIKTLTSVDGRLVINSSAMTYTSTTLLTTVVGLVLVFSVSGWKLNRAIGFTCIVLYIISVTFSCLYELNVFGYLNPPTC